MHNTEKEFIEAIKKSQFLLLQQPLSNVSSRFLVLKPAMRVSRNSANVV
jgi:hypothetical protein